MRLRKAGLAQLYETFMNFEHHTSMLTVARLFWNPARQIFCP